MSQGADEDIETGKITNAAFRRRFMKAYRQNLLGSLDKDLLNKLDKWVQVSAGVAKLILAVATITIGLSILGGAAAFSLSFVTALTGLFVAMILEIGYKYADLADAVDLRVLCFSLSAYALLYSLLYFSMLIVQVLVPHDFFVYAVVILFVGWLVLLWEMMPRVSRFARHRIESVVTKKMEKFKSIIAVSSTGTAMAASPVSNLMAVIMYFPLAVYYQVFPVSPDWALPTAISFIGIAIVLMVVWVKFILPYSILHSVLVTGEGPALDLAAYCAFLADRLTELDIEDYEVLQSSRPCEKARDAVNIFGRQAFMFTFEFQPIGFEPVTLLMRSDHSFDLNQVQQALGEKWVSGYALYGASKSVVEKGEFALPSLSPLLRTVGRLIIDCAVFVDDRVIFASGRPCIGIVMKSEDLPKLKPSLVTRFAEPVL